MQMLIINNYVKYIIYFQKLILYEFRLFKHSDVPEMKNNLSKWFTAKDDVSLKMLRRLKKLGFFIQELSIPRIEYKPFSSFNVILLFQNCSILSTSEYVDEDSQNACGITVGVLASVASVFQAFNAACQFGAERRSTSNRR